jgi:predicted ABC-type ATPase
MPAFTVIAGPNGAGKSAYSKILSPPKAIIFDPDEEKKNISIAYPDISDDALETELTRVYLDIENKVLLNNHDFTVETNFRSPFLIDRAHQFKVNGYKINLIFMMLPDITHSIDRVSLRVKKKGHFVDLESIRINFQLSREHVNRFLPVFDNVLIFDASSNEGTVSSPRLLAKFLEMQITEIDYPNLPLWAKEYIDELCKIIAGKGDGTSR